MKSRILTLLNWSSHLVPYLEEIQFQNLQQILLKKRIEIAHLTICFMINLVFCCKKSVRVC